MRRRRPRIRYHPNEPGIDPVGSFNLCLEYASGGLVKILSADYMLEQDGGPW